uniref:Uncharacterized protein n=1 Tax=Amphimedon queenslandica TaxID=400682 RepID=A0A1X7UX29_AMPQE
MTSEPISSNAVYVRPPPSHRGGNDHLPYHHQCVMSILMGSGGDWELTVEVVVGVRQGEDVEVSGPKEVVAELMAQALVEVVGMGLTMTEVAVEGDQGEEEAEEEKEAKDQEIVAGQKGLVPAIIMHGDKA